MSYYAGSCDVAVIGAGHAGIEAALAAARLGNHTILFTINLDAVGNMPCNPAIGGTGKGHLVRELDALGGDMGAAADHACIQYRMLNRGKGPAVHSLRAQADRVKYRQYMKHVLELQENLELKQAQIVEILTAEGAVTGVRTQLGAEYGAKAVVIATGTYLDSTVITGQSVIPSGPDGMHPSVGLADNLRALGLHLRRFKTGTPPRVNRRSIDFSKMEVQPGDETAEPFSFRSSMALSRSDAGTPLLSKRCTSRRTWAYFSSTACTRSGGIRPIWPPMRVRRWSALSCRCSRRYSDRLVIMR